MQRLFRATAFTRSRRNTRSRGAWLTGPVPRWGYTRTSLEIDAAAEVTISKCNLWKSWTLELTSEFSRAHLTILPQCVYLLVLLRPCKPKKCKTTKNISIFCRVKPKSVEKKSNISKKHLSTVYLKSGEKIKCAISEIQWQIKMWLNRTSFKVAWSRSAPGGGTIQAR